jgi:maltodextrin utilization protein YvdJ
MLHDLFIVLIVCFLLFLLVLGVASFFVFLCERSEEWQRMQDYRRLREEVLSNAGA